MKTFPTKTFTEVNPLTGETIIHINDLYLDGGNIAFVEGIEALKNVIENVLRTQFSELQLNVQKGIPYFETIFSHRTNVSYWRAYMVDAIESVEGVQSCELFDIDIDNEKNLLTYTAYIKTIYGDLSING